MITNDLDVWENERRYLGISEYEVKLNRRCMEEILKHHSPVGLMTYPVEGIETDRKYILTAKTRIVADFKSALDSLNNVEWYLLGAEEFQIDGLTTGLTTIRKIRYAVLGEGE